MDVRICAKLTSDVENADHWNNVVWRNRIPLNPVHESRVSVTRSTDEISEPPTIWIKQRGLEFGWFIPGRYDDGVPMPIVFVGSSEFGDPS